MGLAMGSVPLDGLMVDLAQDLSENKISTTVSLRLLFKSNGTFCREFVDMGKMQGLKVKKGKKWNLSIKYKLD